MTCHLIKTRRITLASSGELLGVTLGRVVRLMGKSMHDMMYTKSSSNYYIMHYSILHYSKNVVPGAYGFVNTVMQDFVHPRHLFIRALKLGLREFRVQGFEGLGCLGFRAILAQGQVLI